MVQNCGFASFADVFCETAPVASNHEGLIPTPFGF
jgi:hypothetical protein